MPGRLVSASETKRRAGVPELKTEHIRKPLRIAIFDDTPDIVEFYTDLLYRLNVNVVTQRPVFSVAEAMKIFRKEKPDLVITDLCLSHNGTEGFSILRNIRHESPDTPVALTTSAYSPTSSDEICKEINGMGFDAVFHKTNYSGIKEFVSTRISS